MPNRWRCSKKSFENLYLCGVILNFRLQILQKQWGLTKICKTNAQRLYEIVVGSCWRFTIFRNKLPVVGAINWRFT
jgi:hypothetical protein